MLDAHIAGFTPPHEGLNGDRGLPASLVDLIRAVMTVGRPSRRAPFVPWITAPPAPPDPLITRLYTAAYHALLLLAHVTRGSSGLRMRESSRQLDGQAKGPIAFHIGMGCAKLFAERELGVPTLHHAGALIEAGVLVLAAGGKRGDLVGWDAQQRWHVIEAKGRSSGGNIAGALAEAKAQASNVRLRDRDTGGLLNPSTASGCVSDLSRHPLGLHVNDPDGEDTAEGTEYIVYPEGAARTYYELGRAILELRQGDLVREPIPGLDDEYVRVSTLPGTRIDVGIHDDVFAALRDEAINWWAFSASFTERWRPRWELLLDRRRTVFDESLTWSIGLDGYFVRTSDFG